MYLKRTLVLHEIDDIKYILSNKIERWLPKNNTIQRDVSWFSIIRQECS